MVARLPKLDVCVVAMPNSRVELACWCAYFRTLCGLFHGSSRVGIILPHMHIFTLVIGPYVAELDLKNSNLKILNTALLLAKYVEWQC